MNTMMSRIFICRVFQVFKNVCALSLILIPAVLSGCGGGVISQSTVSPLSGNTTVTVLATGTANDQLSQYEATLNSLTLTNKSGNSVNLVDSKHQVEFIHLNGVAEPVATVSIPQDDYVSAAATVNEKFDPSFSCLSWNATNGGIEIAYYSTIGATASVNLSVPITISGTSMALSLNLLVSKSASLTKCDGSVLDPFSITPTFNLEAMNISPHPTNSANGKVVDLQGLITSISSDGATLIVAHTYLQNGDTMLGMQQTGTSWQVTVDSTTNYQGVTGASQLATGMPVDMDGNIQADGSILANRVAVYDTNTTDLTIRNGPLLKTNEVVSGHPEPQLDALGFQSQGYLFLAGLGPYFSFNDASYQISGRFTNLQALPFSPVFTAANMVSGQNVWISTHASTSIYGYISAAAITLLPQTINGTVSAISTSGGFTTYTVTLAAYDLFPTFAVQDGQTTVLTNPNTVVVYADSSTQQLNTDLIAVGSVVRFNGLVFNDNGTLRMDCGQISDGVAE